MRDNSKRNIRSKCKCIENATTLMFILDCPQRTFIHLQPWIHSHFQSSNRRFVAYRYLLCSKNFFQYMTCPSAMATTSPASSNVHPITRDRICDVNTWCCASRLRRKSKWSTKLRQSLLMTVQTKK